MKHILFFLICGFGYATSPAQTEDKAIHSVADMERLYSSKPYPMNKVTDTTFQRLKENIVFNDIGDFMGFKYQGGLFLELSAEEVKIFYDLLNGTFPKK